MDYGTKTSAPTPRPSGRMEATIGALEGQSNLLTNNIGRLDSIIRRLRGSPPPTPTVGVGERNPSGVELVRPIVDRASVLADVFGERNSHLDNLLSELDGLI